MFGPRFSVEYYLSKFVESATISRPMTGEILAYSNKLSEANGTTSVTMGEIRAGVGNPIVGVIPSDSNAAVEVTDVSLSLPIRAYQTGGKHGFGAPTLVCADITGVEGKLTIDASAQGTPVAGQGFASAFAYVQTIGESSTILGDGIPYAIDANGVVTGFSATNGTKYKVWYWVQAATTEYTTILANMDPNVVNLRLVYPVYSNVKEDGTGTRIGSLVVIYPFLKLNGTAGINGNGSSNATTSISGTAISYEQAIVSEGCEACTDNSAELVHYLYVPCDGGADKIEGLFLVGGSVEVPANSTAKLNYQLMVNGNPVTPDPALMSYVAASAPSGTSVSNAGVVTAGSTTGDFTVTATYTLGNQTWDCPVSVSIVSA
jgi:hypothetical protein